MIGVDFKILTRTPIPKLHLVPPHHHRGYERVYKFKEQHMNVSTFSEIKYMNRLFFFSKARYMIGVGYKILTSTPIPESPQVPPSFKLFTFCLCKLCAIIFFFYKLSLLSYDEISPRVSLQR